MSEYERVILHESKPMQNTAFSIQHFKVKEVGVYP